MLTLAACGCEVPDGPSSAPEIQVVADQSEAPAWTVAYGDEFWRHATDHVGAAPGQDGTSITLPGQMNLGDVIERVSHAIRKGDGDRPRVASTSYAATFDGRGMRFSPNVPNLDVRGEEPRSPRSNLPPTPSVAPAVADPLAELQIHTARISVGGRVVYRGDDGATAWSVRGNTAQALLAQTPDLVEHYEARAGGVELSWVLRDRPAAAERELVVEVDLAGLVFAGETEHGLHFADGNGMPRVRLGLAELVDARNRRWSVPAELVAGGVRWRVEAAMLTDATFPVALDPIIGAEFGMDEPVPTAAAGDETEPSVASNGTDYFVAWNSTRFGSGGISGTRVTAAGAVLDAGDIAISTRGFVPSVASNGTDYFVAWNVEVPTTTGVGTVYGNRVTASGAVLDAGGIAISAPRCPGCVQRASYPIVASNGQDYFVAWSDLLNANDISDIYGSRVSAAGAVLDASNIAISTAVNHQWLSSVASNGTDYFVSWNDYRTTVTTSDVYGSRVSATGVVLDPSGIAIATAAGGSSVASNGTEYFVAWGGSQGFYGSRVSSAGQVLDASGIALPTGPSTYLGAPSVASNGTDYLVTWVDLNARDMYGSRVSAAGAVLDAGFAITTGGYVGDGYDVASNGTEYFVAWTHTSNIGPDIYGSRVSEAGAVLDPTDILLSTGSNAQSLPSVVSNGTDYLVVWLDNRNGSYDIYGSRVSESGAVLDASGIAIASDIPQTLPSSASVASNGKDYFVAWKSGGGIIGSRVSAGGEVLDSGGLGGIVLSTHTGAQGFIGTAAVASDGTDYFVVWGDEFRDDATRSSGIYGTRVSASGAVLDAGIAISTSGRARNPSVASNGTNYLVAWQDGDGPYYYNLAGSRVSAAGAVLDTSSIAIKIGFAGRSSITSNGPDYLIVYRCFLGLGTSYSVCGSRVTATGAVLDTDGFAISPAAAAPRTLPTVASNGTDYFVVWENESSTDDYNVYGSRVTAEGAVLDADGVAIAMSTPESPLGLAFNASSGDYLIAYGSANRVGARLISDTSGPPGDSGCCSASSDPHRAAGTLVLFILVAFGLRRRRGRPWSCT